MRTPPPKKRTFNGDPSINGYVGNYNFPA
jgi:hypothetical protein